MAKIQIVLFDYVNSISTTEVRESLSSAFMVNSTLAEAETKVKTLVESLNGDTDFYSLDSAFKSNFERYNKSAHDYSISLTACSGRVLVTVSENGKVFSRDHVTSARDLRNYSLFYKDANKRVLNTLELFDESYHDHILACYAAEVAARGVFDAVHVSPIQKQFALAVASLANNDTVSFHSAVDVLCLAVLNSTKYDKQIDACFNRLSETGWAEFHEALTRRQSSLLHRELETINETL